MKSVQLYKRETTSQTFFREFAKFSDQIEMVNSEIRFFPPSVKSKKRKLDEISLYVWIHTTYDILVLCYTLVISSEKIVWKHRPRTQKSLLYLFKFQMKNLIVTTFLVTVQQKSHKFGITIEKIAQLHKHIWYQNNQYFM